MLTSARFGGVKKKPGDPGAYTMVSMTMNPAAVSMLDRAYLVQPPGHPAIGGSGSGNGTPYTRVREMGVRTMVATPVALTRMVTGPAGVVSVVPEHAGSPLHMSAAAALARRTPPGRAKAALKANAARTLMGLMALHP